MELKSILDIQLEKLNFQVRSIKRNDINDDYICGLKENKEYIENIPKNISIKSQVDYVEKINISSHKIIYGLYEKNILIGTSGIQLNNLNEPATIGILIFNKQYKGCGLGKILVWSNCYLSNKIFDIKDFSAGMQKINLASYYSFLGCGFMMENETEKLYTVRLQNFRSLKKPNIINKIKLYVY